jgi:carbamoyl-phosphate synthase large subunit
MIREFLKSIISRFLEHPVEAIKDTEDRLLFANKCTEIGLKVARSKTAKSVDEAINVANEIGFPVMVRIAYALGGLGSGNSQQ